MFSRGCNADRKRVISSSDFGVTLQHRETILVEMFEKIQSIATCQNRKNTVYYCIGNFYSIILLYGDKKS